MSDSRKGTVLKKCQECQVDMNGDMLDAQGLCPHCKAQPKKEQQKSQDGKRGAVTYNANETMDSEPNYSDFITCPRSGRRNAVPDLQGDATRIHMEKLSGTMDEITIEEEENQAGSCTTEKVPKSQGGSSTL
ncbi:cAMP-dependent protein kinase inhibitor gamma [Hemicordylus capensis]|uniref:cAMP-dependent protein kinase inhibitor gamma n=1 Tax=Hemicordylus capensis TaxID=884348 RepID=UPI00230395A0|nr:cAMP-dependent protein kinase inhibitor gamma [Hemicordylus capensis]XP_053106894.1 cAMP-dependent protein kinase inhibitor gamma [Hemicordylus capensis]XP_053106895.1 cAMP-dependent protein kinase inhibitor gamma [Hemicordylus capensis]